MRAILALVLLLLAGCSDAPAAPATATEPSLVPVQILVFDARGAVLPEVDLHLPSHNVTARTTSDRNGTILSLAAGPLTIVANHTHHAEARTDVALTNQTTVRIEMERIPEMWSSSARDTAELVLDCHTPAGACPGSTGTASATFPLALRADTFAAAMHGTAEATFTARLLQGGRVLWEQTFEGAGPHSVVAAPGVAPDTVELHIQATGTVVDEAVKVEWLATRCNGPPASWSLLDPTGWDPRADRAC